VPIYAQDLGERSVYTTGSGCVTSESKFRGGANGLLGECVPRISGVAAYVSRGKTTMPDIGGVRFLGLGSNLAEQKFYDLSWEADICRPFFTRTINLLT
jgi:hypothetical protein